MELGVDAIRRVSRLRQDDPVDQRAPVKPDYVLSASCPPAIVPDSASPSAMTSRAKWSFANQGPGADAGSEEDADHLRPGRQ
jgi:hypothetical protein